MPQQISRNRLFILYHDQDGKCSYCKEPLIDDCRKGKTPHIDHMISRKNGGTGKKDNLCLSCRQCNLIKSTRNAEEFMQYLQPFFEGRCEKKDLLEYHKWLELNKKFKQNEGKT